MKVKLSPTVGPGAPHTSLCFYRCMFIRPAHRKTSNNKNNIPSNNNNNKAHYVVWNLPVNAQDSNDAHSCELVADVHHHHRLAHEVAEHPLSVSNQLVNVEGHHEQEERVRYGQVQHVDVRHHLLLARRHRVDDQSVGDDSHRAQDPVDGREDVHESCDVDVAVGRPGGGQVAARVALGAVHLGVRRPEPKRGVQTWAAAKWRSLLRCPAPSRTRLLIKAQLSRRAVKIESTTTARAVTVTGTCLSKIWRCAVRFLCALHQTLCNVPSLQN